MDRQPLATPPISLDGREASLASPTKRRAACFISIASFNILAPCYKRIMGTSSSSPHRMRESQLSGDGGWKERMHGVVACIMDCGADVVCLQEFWCAEPAFLQLFASHDSPVQKQYSLHVCQRPNGKADGVAILIKKDVKAKSRKISVVREFNSNFGYGGQRVALTLLLRVGVLDGEEGKFGLILLSNTHLTFPHHEHDLKLRRMQMTSCLDEMETRVNQVQQETASSCASLVVGDFNCAHSDPLRDDVYNMVHGREPGATHMTHRGEALPVDFVFIRQAKASEAKPNAGGGQPAAAAPLRLQPYSACLLPKSLPDSTWPAADDFCLSDHRPLLAKLGISL